MAITYRADEDVRVSTLREFGIRAYSSLVYPHKPDMAEWLNGWANDFAANHEDCLHTATFYPEESATAYVSRAIQAGTRVFKSHIQVGDYSPMDSLLDGVWSQIADSQVPVIIHCGSGPAPGRYTGPEPIRALLHRFPSLPLIIAHMGMPEYEPFLDLAQEYPNVHLDTTMAFTDFARSSPRPPPSCAPASPTPGGTRCCSAATSPTSPTATRMRSRSSPASTWATTGCAMCSTATVLACSASVKRGSDDPGPGGGPATHRI